MRRIKILFLGLIALSYLPVAVAETAVALPVVKTGFVSEMVMTDASRVIGWHDENLFVAKKDGSIVEVSQSGSKRATLQAKDSKGTPILKKPEAAVVSDGVVYVADSESNLVAMFALDGKFLGSFGAKRGGFFGGSSDVELNSPHALAVYEGIVYVADTGNSKLRLYGVNGVFLTTLEIESVPENKMAKEKDLPYKLGEPVDIAVNDKGDIYVLDAKDSLVKIYRADGKFLRSLPKNGKPMEIEVSADGVYVADRETLVVQRYDFNDRLTYSFGSKGEGRGLFKSLSGLVAGKNGVVYVGDAKKGAVDIFQAESGVPLERLPKTASRTSVRLQQTIAVPVGKLAWDGKNTLYGIDAEKQSIIRIQDGVVAGEIKSAEITPVGLAVDKSGILWVLDKKNAKVLRMDESGTVLSSIGSKGSKKGQFDDPTDIAIASNGDIYIADRGNNWVQVFSKDGSFVKAVTKGISKELDEPISISLDTLDNLYVLEKGRSMVIVFSAKGEPLTEFGKNQDESISLSKPVGLVAMDDEVLVLDNNQVKVFTHDGKFRRAFSSKGNAAGELDEPLAITAKNQSAVFISERGNKRVQTFVMLPKPAAPENLVAEGVVHAVELRWGASPSYVSKYRIYRSKSNNSGFVEIGSSQGNQYSDQGLAGDEKYFYRIGAESDQGYEGATSVAVEGVSQKFMPPILENVKTDPTAWQVKMNWSPVDPQYVSAYLVYQKEGDTFTKIAESSQPEFIKIGLKPDTKYTFQISTRSVDNVESPRCTVHATTLPFNKAPLEIEVLKLSDVFSNTYKLYEEDGVGKIKVTNNTGKAMSAIKVSFVLKNVMDFPTETNIPQLLPGQSEEISLKAVFNNAILNVSEDSSVQALIEASYYENGTPVVYSRNSTVKIYDKHRLTWDERGRYAAFITPKDTPIINFVRSVASQMHDAKDTAQLAAGVFAAMGVAGLTYLPDPSNPYQISSGKADTVDYIQYPRETMRLKSGDCDDLVAVYTSSLESLGIYTLIVEVPGHMFMMFSTGIDADADGYTNNDLYVIHNGKLWIPVETTVVGSPFMKAWEQGAANYYKWKDKGLTLLNVHESWATFKPATLPPSTQAPLDISVKQIDTKFPGDMTSVLKISSQTKIRKYMQAIEKNPDDMEAYLQAGIVLARFGDRTEAVKYMDKVLAKEPNNAAALNNRGNIFMMGGDYAEAQKNYFAASQSDPKDAEIWVNLAKSYKSLKDNKKAKEAMMKAQKQDATIKNKYKALSLELLNAL